METNVTKKREKKVAASKISKIQKYKIDELLYDLPYSQAVAAKKQIPDLLNITRQTFALYRKATITDKLEIPTNNFLRLCVFFNIEPIKMVNYKIDEIIILDQSQSNQSAIAMKIGLVQ